MWLLACWPAVAGAQVPVVGAVSEAAKPAVQTVTAAAPEPTAPAPAPVEPTAPEPAPSEPTSAVTSPKPEAVAAP